MLKKYKQLRDEYKAMKWFVLWINEYIDEWLHDEDLPMVDSVDLRLIAKELTFCGLRKEKE